MKILGIDPGLRCTGFGVIEAEGAKLHYVASGTIKTEAAAIGLVNYAVPRAELMTKARELATVLAAKSPTATRSRSWP